MDDIPLPGITADPNPVEPSVDFPELPAGSPSLPPEQKSLPDEPPTLPEVPEDPPEPSSEPPAPLTTPTVPFDEAPAPPDDSVSFLGGSNTSATDDMNSNDPIQGPQPDPNSVASFVSTVDLTNQPCMAPAANVDGTSSVSSENHPLQNMPNVSAPGTIIFLY